MYIVAQQATQVYYLSYPCQTDHRLRGWDVVYKVSPHGKLPLPNNEDYNNDRVFFSRRGATREFRDRLIRQDRNGSQQWNLSEDDIPPSNSAGYVDIADSDDEDFDPANPDYDDYF